jgi:hypothetical protein
MAKTLTQDSPSDWRKEGSQIIKFIHVIHCNVVGSWQPSIQAALIMKKGRANNKPRPPGPITLFGVAFQ